MSDDALELAARLRLSTARLARILRQQAGTGLSPSQQSVLASIEAHGPLTLGRLAKIEQVTPPTITRILGKLEDDGLVSRTVDVTDRRISRVEITAEGRRRNEHSRQRRNAWLAERLALLSPADRADLTNALRVIEGLATAPEVEVPPVDDDREETEVRR
jgi:DNA-binding MarR family transcriptional regulator